MLSRVEMKRKRFIDYLFVSAGLILLASKANAFGKLIQICFSCMIISQFFLLSRCHVSINRAGSSPAAWTLADSHAVSVHKTANTLLKMVADPGEGCFLHRCFLNSFACFSISPTCFRWVIRTQSRFSRGPNDLTDLLEKVKRKFLIVHVYDLILIMMFVLQHFSSRCRI